MIDRLMPDNYAMGCWPSERHLGLVHSQQLAVNTILATLGDSQGLLGINGPPGTGKTTLLRDLIAAIVTSRADALSKLRRASDGFVTNGREAANDNGKQQVCFKLNPALYGFEIVVASSNNGAVENVTLELPQRDKIDESWLPEAEYFAKLGELVSGKPAWGLISGALGSKTRRTRFVERYFYGQRPFDSENKANPEAEDEAAPDDKFDDVLNAWLSPPSLAEENHGACKDCTNDPSDKEERPKGFLGWLNEFAEVNKTRSPEQRKVLWQKAIDEYEAAKTEVRKSCAATHRIRELIQALRETKKQVADQSDVLSSLEKERLDAVNQLSGLDAKESRSASAELKQCLDALEKHQACKPGFWAIIFSLWGARRDWNARRRRLESQYDLAKSEFNRIARLSQQLDASRERLEKRITDTRHTLQHLRDQYRAQKQDAIDVAGDGQADHLLAWLRDGAIGRGEAIELSDLGGLKAGAKRAPGSSFRHSSFIECFLSWKHRGCGPTCSLLTDC